MYSGYSESSNCSDFIADLDDDSNMDLEGDGPIFSKKSYNCYYDKIEFEINRIFHAEYQNQITTLEVAAYLSRGNYSFLAMSFEHDNELETNRDDVIAKTDEKNREILKRQEQLFVIHWNKFIEFRTCACKDGYSVNPSCVSFTVDTQSEYGRIYEQRWYFYTSLAAVILSVAGSFGTFVYCGGVGLLRDNSLKVELKKWKYLEPIFKGSTKSLKKYIVIILPILYSITDSYSDYSGLSVLNQGD